MAGCQQSYNAAGNVQYNYAQLEGIWIKAGGSAQDAPTAAAIAMAESGGNSTATCVDSSTSVDRGLWQINSSNGTASSYDVMTNARGAVALFNQRQWQPWVTYQTGAYRGFLQNVPPDNSVSVNGTSAASTQLTSAQSAQDASLFCNDITRQISPAFCIGDMVFGKGLQQAIDYAIIQVLKAVLNPFIAFFGGVIGVLSGGVLMFYGVYMLVRESDTGQQAIGAARTGAGTAALAAGQPEVAVMTQRGGTQRIARQRTELAGYQQRQTIGTQSAQDRAQISLATSQARSRAMTQELIRRQVYLNQLRGQQRGNQP